MIPAKVEDLFIQLTTDYTGVIEQIIAGNLAKAVFKEQESIYDTCFFLEGTLEAVPLNESFLMEGMVIATESEEFNVDVEIYKSDSNITITLHNRTKIYKFVSKLNQSRNDIFFIKREINQKNKELDKLRKIADKASEEKSRFLATMSHEIRNPLNLVLGFTEMILSEDINENVKKYASFLSVAGKNLKVIVEDVLDLSRIESGRLELVLEQISIKNIVETCINSFKVLQQQNDVDLQFIVSKEVPEVILGDSVRLTQVLSNLINNAIKFTKRGSIKTIVSLLSEEDKTVILQFKITDTGKGISKELVSKIFDEYQQTELNDNRIHGGVGLGLAIVKRIVNAMNGRISVDSKLTIGSTFTVELPFNKIDKKYIRKEEKSSELAVNILDKKKILIADDDKLNQTIVSHILRKENAEIIIVNDGLEALNKIKEEAFDIILLDNNMPNMTGKELMLQKNSIITYNKNTPFLALTANTSKKDLERYNKLGFVAVISKPFSAAEFLNKIKSIFS